MWPSSIGRRVGEWLRPIASVQAWGGGSKLSLAASLKPSLGGMTETMFWRGTPSGGWLRCI